MRLRYIVVIMVVVLAVLFLLPVAVFFAVQHPKVQQRLVHEATQVLSTKLNTTVSVSSVHFRLFNRLVLNDVYVQDLKGDTLLYAGEAAVSLSRFRLAEKYVEVSKLALEQVKMSLVRDTSATLNMKFIVDGLKKQDVDTVERKPKAAETLKVKVNRVTAQGVDFSFVDELAPPSFYENTISYKDLHIKNLAMDVREVNLNGDTMTCVLEALKLRERGGFNLRRLSGQVSVAPTFIEVKRLQILDDYSNIRARYYRMDFDDYGAFRDYVERVRMSADFTSAKLNLYTIGFFAKTMPKVQLPLTLTGHVNGTVSNLKGYDLDLKYGVKTATKLNFSMMGLPDVHNTFFTFDVKEVVSVGNDIMLADSVVLEKKNARHATLLQHLGALNGRARFTGFLSNFVADGELLTDRGVVTADLSFAPALDSAVAISGTLGTDNFDLGSILNDSIVGRIGLHGKVKGTFKNLKKMALNLDVDMPLVELRGYAYRSAKVKGLFTERSFNGALSCDDKNLNFNFQGNVDFEKEKSTFDFNLHLRHADLGKLHIITRDSIAQLSLTAKAEAEGSSLDDFTGQVHVSNAKYLSQMGEFVTSSVQLNARNQGEEKNVTLKSDMLDATLRAKGGFSSLPAVLNHVMGYYIPAFSQLLNENRNEVELGKAEKLQQQQADSLPQDEYEEQQDTKSQLAKNAEYTFSVSVKKTAQKVLDVVAPGFALADSTQLSGRISTDVQRTRLNMRTNSARIGSVNVANFMLRSTVRDSALRLTAKADRVGNGDFSVEALHLNTTLKAGRADLKVDYETSIASGYVKADAQIFRDAHNHLGVDVGFDSSKLVLGDTVWSLLPSKLRYEKERFSIRHFRAESAHQSEQGKAQHSQMLYANGFISNSLNDTLTCEMRNVDMALLLRTAGVQKVDISGELSGKVSINGVLAPFPLFFANVKALNVYVVENEVGNVTLQSFMEHGEKDVTLRLRVEQKEAEVLSVGGIVKPSGDMLAMAKFSRVKLDYLNSLLGDALSDIGGALSGSLRVSGSLKQPQLNGRLQLENGSLRVKILNSLYKLSGAVDVENSNMHMSNWLAVDDKNATSPASFSLFNLTQPSKLHYTLKVEPENFHVLNSSELNSQHFYGQGYASGVVQINGRKGEANINVVATTERNTQVSIPLVGREYTNAQQTSFIDFVTPAGKNQVAQEENRVKVASNIRADLDFRVTPDAEVQLVLNQNTGDVIKAAGSGNIKLELQPNSDIFRVFGTYNLMRGEYTVSIQNLFNRKFKVDNGSVIHFNGDIDAATADIWASYKQLRLPLADLFNDSTYSRPVPIDCKVHITDRLTAPNLKFSIDAPTVDVETRDRMRAQLNDDNVVMQFMSLILAGMFYVDQGGGASGNAIVGGLGGRSLSTFLNSQFSALLSQVVPGGLDVSVKVPVGQSADQDWGATLSKSFGDRVSATVGAETQSRRKLVDPNASSFVYDFDVQYMLDEQGRLRLKAFSHANDQYMEMSQSSNRFGVGVVYQEEFDDFADWWQAVFRKKRQQDSLKVEQEKRQEKKP